MSELEARRPTMASGMAQPRDEQKERICHIFRALSPEKLRADLLCRPYGPKGPPLCGCVPLLLELRIRLCRRSGARNSLGSLCGESFLRRAISDSQMPNSVHCSRGGAAGAEHTSEYPLESTENDNTSTKKRQSACRISKLSLRIARLPTGSSPGLPTKVLVTWYTVRALSFRTLAHAIFRPLYDTLIS